MPPKNPEAVPQQMRPIYDAIVELTDPFCKEHLTEGYATLARKMAAALARKRPSPLTSGKINTWACGIIYALGSINFLFDKSQKPHLTAAEVCELFGVSKSTGGNKSRAIQDALGTGQLDPDWWLPSKLGDNPLVWMFEVNGFIVDIRYAPREVQEEVFRQGLILYIPDAPPERR